MQLVHTLSRFTVPCTFARTCCKFGNQRRFVLLLAWLTLFPTEGRLPHNSQTRAIIFLLRSPFLYHRLPDAARKVCSVYSSVRLSYDARRARTNSAQECVV